MTERAKTYLGFLIGFGVLVAGIILTDRANAKPVIVHWLPTHPCTPINPNWSASNPTGDAPLTVTFTLAQDVSNPGLEQIWYVRISTSGDTNNLNLNNVYTYTYNTPGTVTPVVIIDYLGPKLGCPLSITSALPYQIAVGGTNSGQFVVRPPTSYSVSVCSNSSISEVFTLSNLTASTINGGTVTLNNGTDYSITAGATFTMSSHATTNITVHLAPTRTGSYSSQVIFAATSTDSKTGWFTAVSLSNVVAGFASDVTNGVAPLSITFTNQSLIWTNADWDFGDGFTASGVTALNVSHAYTNGNTNAASLIAFGLCGSSTSSYNIGMSTTNPACSNCTAAVQPDVTLIYVLPYQASPDESVPWTGCLFSNACAFPDPRLSWYWGDVTCTDGASASVSVTTNGTPGSYSVNVEGGLLGPGVGVASNSVPLSCSNGLICGSVTMNGFLLVKFGACPATNDIYSADFCASDFETNAVNGSWAKNGSYTGVGGIYWPEYTNATPGLLLFVSAFPGGPTAQYVVSTNGANGIIYFNSGVDITGGLWSDLATSNSSAGSFANGACP